MKKNILFFLAWVIITLIVWRFFINYWKQWNDLNNQTSFEDKEKCMKYYDSFKETLEERWNSDEDSKEKYWYTSSLANYEMFYSPQLDSCVSAYNIFWFTYDTDNNMHPYPNDTYAIVDYLNWEKELYSCTYNAYMVYLQGWDYSDITCTAHNREKEKDKYRN